MLPSCNRGAPALTGCVAESTATWLNAYAPRLLQAHKLIVVTQHTMLNIHQIISSSVMLCVQRSQEVQGV